MASSGASLLGSAFTAAALHASNRARLVARFAGAGAKTAGAAPLVALLKGGEQETRHATDTDVLFRQESYFAWAFGVREPDCYGYVNLTTGESVLAVPKLDAAYAVWLGEIHPPEHYRKHYGVDRAIYVDDLGAELKALNPAAVYLLSGLNTDSKKTHKAPQLEGDAGFEGLVWDKSTTLHAHLNECRVVKTDLELDLMRYVNRVSSRAHVEVMKQAKPGMREYELEAIFLHHSYRFGGCRHTSYTCICGIGPHAAVLHYGHAAAPNDGPVEDGSLALLDMGAEYHCYSSDITCTFPVNGKFTAKQANVYNTVLKAQLAVFAAIKPGVFWADMHRLAARIIAEELLKHGLLKGSLDDIIMHHVPALFFPHGLGHLMGLDVHDVGGYPDGMQRINEPGIRSLRTLRQLEQG